MEQVITSSVEYPFGTATEKIAENLSELAKNAGVTLSGGGDFVINGDEVQEVTLQGADYNYDSATKKAGITIPTAVQEVSVIGGALQASIEGSKLFLLGSNATVQKASANFAVTPASR